NLARGCLEMTVGVQDSGNISPFFLCRRYLFYVRLLCYQAQSHLNHTPAFSIAIHNLVHLGFFLFLGQLGCFA
ncbi:MAG TPA: hypothetical protein PLB14_07065, partial [Smithellaceae bacterium]|nr:hypothetical protein [Smithellaceae bacterium]